MPAKGEQPKEVDIITAASKSAAGYKVPARVWFLEELPVTRSASATKVQRGALRKMALERLR